MSTQSFDVVGFQAQFPEFATFNQAQLAGYWTMASQYLSPNDGTLLFGAQLALALNLLTAHIAKLFQQITSGATPGVVTGGTEGGVSVSIEPPPSKSAFQYWLSTTPYGLQLRALLGLLSAGGLSVGGSCERGQFRKAGGLF